MTIFGGDVKTQTGGQTTHYVNMLHVLVIAPWLYYISTQPDNWQMYLRVTALSVGAWHGYKWYTKKNSEVPLTTELNDFIHKGETTVLSMLA
jgi:hypothetical protein